MFFIYYARINVLRLAAIFFCKGTTFISNIKRHVFGGRKQVKTKEEKRSIKEKEMKKTRRKTLLEVQKVVQNSTL